jgi:4-carboxymuconolactone decarboxylase
VKCPGYAPDFRRDLSGALLPPVAGAIFGSGAVTATKKRARASPMAENIAAPSRVRASAFLKFAIATQTRDQMAKSSLPSDVYEDSRCRVPLPKREELDEAGRKIYDHHQDPKGGSLAGLNGPGGIRLHSPKLSALQAPASRYLRFEAGFSGRIRELIILVTAREMDSEFEWFQHEREALKEGLPQAIVDVVKHRKSLAGIPEPEATVIELGRQLIRTHRLDSATFARAETQFGRRGVVDLVSLMGNYAATALLLAAFDAQLPDGEEPQLAK